MNKFTRILSRRVPYVVLSWRYILPCKSPALRLHRLACINGSPRYSRLLWYLVLIYSTGSWYLLWSWFHLFIVIKRRKNNLIEAVNVSACKEICDVLRLTFGMTTPPYFYYTYRLYMYSRPQWWQFIFTHEVNAWHSCWNTDISGKSRRLMQDKMMFADYGHRSGLSTISTKVLKDYAFFLSVTHKTPQFIKPRIGSRNEKGFAVSALTPFERYQVESAKCDHVHSKSDSLLWLKKLCLNEEFIYQDLLVNSKTIEKLTNAKQLVTFRIVSIVVNGVPRIMAATMELPIKNEYILPVLIDKQSGTLSLSEPQNAKLSEMCNNAINCGGRVLPIWPDLKRVALSAHSFVLDIPSVGWDLVHTDNGCYLLEGNLNWSVAAHQTAGPELMADYISLLKSKKDKS